MVMIRSKCYPHKWVWLYAQWDRHTDTRLMLYSIHYRCSQHNKNCRDDNSMHECNITFQRHNDNTDIWNYKFSPLLRYTGKKAKIITVWDWNYHFQGTMWVKIRLVIKHDRNIMYRKINFCKIWRAVFKFCWRAYNTQTMLSATNVTWWHTTNVWYLSQQKFMKMFKEYLYADKSDISTVSTV